MSLSLPDEAKGWIDNHEFATIATIEPDGRPHLSVVWVGYDGDDLLISTVEGRRKHKNLLRDPRATVLIYPRDMPYRYLEVRGTTTMTREGGRELIDHFAAEYSGLDRYPHDDGTDNVRVVVRLTAEKVILRKP
jgi:PPOX class probable F420-dependent enzyme